MQAAMSSNCRESLQVASHCVALQPCIACGSFSKCSTAAAIPFHKELSGSVCSMRSLHRIAFYGSTISLEQESGLDLVGVSLWAKGLQVKGIYMLRLRYVCHEQCLWISLLKVDCAMSSIGVSSAWLVVESFSVYGSKAVLTAF